MTTETIDKLFLELSQFTSAKTKRELELEAEIASHGPEGRNVTNGQHFELRRVKDALEVELRRWQSFAAYCYSCARSGECEPQDFTDFCRIEGLEITEETLTNHEH